MRATPRLSASPLVQRRASRTALPVLLATAGAAAVALFALAGCNTMATRTGPVDDGAGRVTGNFYYLPKGLFRIRGGYADKEYAITVSVTYVADPRRRFYLEPQHNFFFDDEYKLQINAKGLLDTVQVTAEDRIADLAGDIAQVAAGSLKFAAGADTGSFDLRDLAAKNLEPFDYTFDIREAPEVRRRLLSRGFDLEIIAHNPAGAQSSGVALHHLVDESAGKQMRGTRRGHGTGTIAAGGVIFRPGRAYTVRLTDLPFRRRLAAEIERQAAAAQKAAARPRQLDAGADAQAANDELARRAASFQAQSAAHENPSESLRIQTTVLLPDEETQLLFTFGRTPFIKRTDNLALNDGMLTKIDGSRPSPIVGFLQIPKKILGAIVPLPLELKNTQITNIKAARSLEILRASESDAGSR